MSSVSSTICNRNGQSTKTLDMTLDENSALVWFESLIEDFLVHFFDKLKFPDFRFFTRLCYHYSSIVIVGDYDYLPVSEILAK